MAVCIKYNVVIYLCFYVVRPGEFQAFEDPKPTCKPIGSGRLCRYFNTCTRCNVSSDFSTSACVSCTKQKLEAIPRFLPKNIEYLDLSRNAIGSLEKQPFKSYLDLRVIDLSFNNIRLIEVTTFLGLKHLQVLDLHCCNLKAIQTGAFASLQSLSYLDMSYNVQLTFGNLRNITYGLNNTDIRTLKLNQIHSGLGPCTVLTKTETEFLYWTDVKKLYLDSNRICTLERNVVASIPPNIQILSLRDNMFMLDCYIVDIYFKKPFKKLKKVYLSDQHQTFFINDFNTVNEKEKREVKRKQVCIEQCNVDTQNNTKRITCTKINSRALSVSIPKSLTYIDWSNSKMRHVLGPVLLKTPNSLTHLILRRNIFWKWQDSLKGFDHLKYLDLSYNSCENISFNFFEYMPNLVYLNLSKNFLGFSLPKDKNGVIFQNQGKIEVLDLHDNKIKVLPYKIFQGLASLKDLHLSKNLLLKFEVKIDHIKNMQFIDFYDNYLEYLSTNVTYIFDRFASSRSLTLNLRRNDLKCSCQRQNTDFLEWLQTSNVHFKHFRAYQCRFENGTVVPLQNRVEVSAVNKRLKQECSTYWILVLVSASLIMLVLSVTITGVVYRYRWNLRYIFHIAKFKIKGFEMLKTDDDTFQFDAFVSYAEEDRQFVRQSVLKQLELKRNMTLLVHDRDFIAGQYVGDNIIKAITSSRKTLIIMSRWFLKSSWCMYELNMALMEEISTGRNVLCIMLKENIPSHEMPLEVVHHMKTQTYIEYPNEEQLQDTFWERLETCLLE